MKTLFTGIIFLLFFSVSYSQSKNEKAIRSLLSNQEVAWNSGNIENFMKGYWQNDSLMFIGKSGVTYGWRKTLDNYKKHYPDTVTMGKLNFKLLELKALSKEYFFVVGKWHLQRSIGDLEGHFTLLFKKINGEWFIVADHSS
ncbi:MAG: nuclear transport factor 2 family protein [Bacteroidota bacterium]|nr:nuclear transport factor 2 family protein [Bacteroidota bacterium]